ncbi:MAG TPA: histidine kinase [Gaiellaceae bacterium]|jgi:two-component system NarL family sensor kinase
MTDGDNEALDRLISAEQDERRRLALFLHDGPVQNLAGIALMLDGALHSLSGEGSEQARTIIETALAQQRATIRELRDLSFVLEPVVLRDHGFGPAVRALADQAIETYGIKVDVDTAPRTVIGETASVALYTILRELIDQAIRRGPPGRIHISLAPMPDEGLSASVSDNADPERRRRSLESIEERVRALHGEVVVSTTEDGTEVRVTLPPHTARR